MTKHPEVKLVGFVTPLFAGTTSLSSFRYSSGSFAIVKKLKQRSRSAGNRFICGPSETIRGEIVENVKPISDHVPTHQRPLDGTSFGHYLAGLIDGDGHFSTQQQLEIAFHIADVPLAYYLKSRLGFGNVYNRKDALAVRFIISKRAGIEKVLLLINGKMRNKKRYDQVINNVLAHKKYAYLLETLSFTQNVSRDLRNHWLAGFSDADANFQVVTVLPPGCRQIRLQFEVSQKTEYLLALIKGHLGGSIGHRMPDDTYYYGSSSFGSARNVINYFDHFHLLSSKHLNYLK